MTQAAFISSAGMAKAIDSLLWQPATGLDLRLPVPHAPDDVVMKSPVESVIAADEIGLFVTQVLEHPELPASIQTLWGETSITRTRHGHRVIFESDEEANTRARFGMRIPARGVIHAEFFAEALPHARLEWTASGGRHPYGSFWKSKIDISAAAIQGALRAPFYETSSLHKFWQRLHTEMEGWSSDTSPLVLSAAGLFDGGGEIDLHQRLNRHGGFARIVDELRLKSGGLEVVLQKDEEEGDDGISTPRIRVVDVVESSGDTNPISIPKFQSFSWSAWRLGMYYFTEFLGMKGTRNDGESVSTNV